MDVPRGKRPTSADRLTSIARTGAGLGMLGATRMAKPVRPVKYINTPARAAASSGGWPDRIIVRWDTDDVVSDSGIILGWNDGILDQQGTSLGLAPGGDDGAIYMFEAGVYAFTATLNVGAIGPPTSSDISVRIQMECFDANIGTFRAGCGMRGGDSDQNNTNLDTVSRTFYSTGSSGGASVTITVGQSNVGAPGGADDVGNVTVTLTGQRVS